MNTCKGCIHNILNIDQIKRVYFSIDDGLRPPQVCYDCYIWSMKDAERKNYEKNEIIEYIDKLIEEI